MKRAKHLEKYAPDVLVARVARASRKRFEEFGRKMRVHFGRLAGTDRHRRERERWRTLTYREPVIGHYSGVTFYVDGVHAGDDADVTIERE